MKKIAVLLFVLTGFLFTARADHITGGEIYYTLAGVSNGQYQYNVTVKIYMICNTTRQFNDPSVISVFDKANGNRVKDISVPVSSIITRQLSNPSPCITNPPDVCYRVGYYTFTLSLPASSGGYIITAQVVYRVEGIRNLVSNYSQVGATYTAEIPGTASLADAPKNNSARFTGDDLVIVCAHNNFSYSFSASDADNDQLRYSFCNAYRTDGGGFGNTTAPDPPPYASVPYGQGYSGSVPLGNDVHIDQSTGLITGMAPASGIYVVTVCVDEIRNGVVIATQRKDLQLNIAACTIAEATLPPKYMLCRNTQTVTLSNLSNSPLITSYEWEVLNAEGAAIFQSTQPTATYTFPAAGTYQVKLFVNRDQDCSDSTVSDALVYPGFLPDFNASGICFGKPTLFADLSTTVYGQVNSWRWDFGESSASDDSSDARDPTYQYPSTGIKAIRLIAGSTVGCIDTAYKNLGIVDRPPISLAFRDTLICTPDALQLQAAGEGNFSWTPSANMAGAQTPTPTVSPPVTTTYYVNLDDNGCRNTDSVNVRVVDHVSLQPMNDTTVCQGDTIPLHLVSDGLQYAWSPASQVTGADRPDAMAVGNATTLYTVTASIGSCTATGRVLVTAVPYPRADAGSDTMICYRDPAYLHGYTDGSSVSWSPAASLDNSHTLQPVANPDSSTMYILSATDQKGCPKPGLDTLLVTVLPPIRAFAGRDTTVVIDQPLQLHASGGTAYSWSPPIGLSATDTADPIALYNMPSAGIRYEVLVYNEAGCASPAYLTVKVYKTLPTVFVPNAFTPNGDGHNDVLRPIAVGMQRIDYFNVYNRWGQLVFSTHTDGAGWDGNLGGHPQPSGVFVWSVKAVDYTGTPYFRKGEAVLIR